MSRSLVFEDKRKKKGESAQTYSITGMAGSRCVSSIDPTNWFDLFSADRYRRLVNDHGGGVDASYERGDMYSTCTGGCTPTNRRSGASLRPRL